MKIVHKLYANYLKNPDSYEIIKLDNKSFIAIDKLKSVVYENKERIRIFFIGAEHRSYLFSVPKFDIIEYKGSHYYFDTEAVQYYKFRGRRSQKVYNQPCLTYIENNPRPINFSAYSLIPNLTSDKIPPVDKFWTGKQTSDRSEIGVHRLSGFDKKRENTLSFDKKLYYLIPVIAIVVGVLLFKGGFI